MTELNEILSKYSTLLESMKQLETEASLIEEIYKEVQTIIKKQSAVESEALDRIKTQADASIKILDRIEVVTKDLKQQYDNYEVLVEKSKKQQDEFLRKAEEKITLLQKLSQKQTADIDISEIYSRLSRAENILSALEGQGRNYSPDTTAKPAHTNKPSRSTYSTAKGSFPNDAKHFTFDDIKRVTGKKPYGIVIEGNIIKVQYWTNMLDSVIPYVFEKYEGDVDKLCDMNYGISLPDENDKEKFIPYFIKGVQYTDKNNQSYRPLNKIGMSVRYCGAEETIEELRLLLCDYFGIDEKHIELFYHDKK